MILKNSYMRPANSQGAKSIIFGKVNTKLHIKPNLVYMVMNMSGVFIECLELSTMIFFLTITVLTPIVAHYANS